MWRYPIANCFFLVLLHNTYCCFCNQQHGLVNAKGETGTDHKRQTDFEEYSASDFEIENIAKARDTETSVYRDTFLEKFNATEIDNETSTLEVSTENFIVPTIFIVNITTETTTLQVNTTTERATTKTSAITETTVIPDTDDTSESSVTIQPSVRNSNEILEANITNIETEPLYTELNMGKEEEVSIYCNKYKKTEPLDINKMSDIWKIAYYTMPHKLKCFKLHIKLLTNDDKLYYSKVYGNFNNKITWEKCELEIMSRDSNNDTSHRKHFLQIHDTIPGVMKNIIIEEEFFAKSSSISLVEEVPDQWLVNKNLLLMRDCTNGDVVIFSRVPIEPKIIDIEDALKQFGESSFLNEHRHSQTLLKKSSDQWLVKDNVLLMRDCLTGNMAIFTRVSSKPKKDIIETALEMFGEPNYITGPNYTPACSVFVDMWKK